MAGVYAPVTGSVRREGRVATMLEIGAGLDIELSGYENIARMSRLLGMDRAGVQANIADIEAFCELGEFLSLPVRTYSAGMMARLIFAVATSTRPDLLLVDEIFGTGDAGFQAKAKERMENLIRSVGIFVFASHSNEMVAQYCNRFLSLDQGIVREITRDELAASGN
jgi:lipopolysaccharide transport system ATP-binding protein